MELEAKKQFLRDLFDWNKSPKHAIRIEVSGKHDIKTLSFGTLEERVKMEKEQFEHELDCFRALDDDRVPMLHIWTATEIFARAFGSPVHKLDNSMPFALPAVSTPEEADQLEEPDIFGEALGEVFDIGDRLVSASGQDYPIRICDIQSPFDISALIWKKEAFFYALADSPGSVHSLLDKVTRTLERFIGAFMRRYRDPCLVHHPNLWMPPEFGMCLSEDDVGSISRAHFREFCEPYLRRLSSRFGGISIHCCARSEHQWDNFLRLPGLRYLNLSHPPTDLELAIRRFSSRAVLVPGGTNGHSSYVDFVKECLSLALPGTRFYFIAPAESLSDARSLLKEIRSLLSHTEHKNAD